eukprot:TRINITY_DN8550_c0_g1_i2.p1 TRINITY_DN8550_c0_g1~~TRINITY_DN8550_c0_g1_i2.p1  ORF type:complete len:267 (-),score=57.02 TRINITY_DN8550_c0_g1_i2:127-927(-)
MGKEIMHVFYQIDHEFVTMATLLIFCVTYIGIAMGKIWGLKLDRTGITLLGAIAMLALGCVSLSQAVASISMESILLLFSLMLVASQLHFAGFYHKVAGEISSFLARPKLFLAILMITSCVLSAFLYSGVICFACTPVVAGALLRKRMNPVPFLIFFFQAEDGIRDVERSRGLGDVYKRQVSTQSTWGKRKRKGKEKKRGRKIQRVNEEGRVTSKDQETTKKRKKEESWIKKKEKKSREKRIIKVHRGSIKRAIRAEKGDRKNKKR